MSGFKKAKAQQAALKVGLYGPPGSGKTFTSLLLSEGLAKLTGKRTAYVDTERGTDFYCQAVKERKIHPAAFDFDAIYTRSITEVLRAVSELDPKEHGQVVLDSVTHIWEACIAAYGGRQTRAGTIPMQAWGKIKKPYKELMSLLLSSPMHVFICGRQGTEYATDDETEELKAVGVKMKAEGETPYEPHILIRMERIRARKTNEVDQVIAYAEKDRTGVLSGRSFVDPTFESLCSPLLGLLGASQAHISSADSANIDIEELARQDAERAENSAEQLRIMTAKISLCSSPDELKKLAKEITPAFKSRMLPADVSVLRERYQERESALSGNGGHRQREPGEDDE
jgi:hypothetical protein